MLSLEDVLFTSALPVTAEDCLPGLEQKVPSASGTLTEMVATLLGIGSWATGSLRVGRWGWTVEPHIYMLHVDLDLHQRTHVG